MEINNATVLEEVPLLARLRLLGGVGSGLLGKHGLRMKSPQVLTRRRAGVLAHPTSLPGTQLQGTIGGDARRFVDWCVEAKIGVWQVLPLGPTHEDRSPYQCQSVLAGNPELIDRSEPMAPDWPTNPALPVATWLREARLAFEEGANDATRNAFANYVQTQAGWLDDYALFRALRAAHNGLAWWDWEAPLAARNACALSSARARYAARIVDEQFGQFLFDYQWQLLRRHAQDNDIELFGDAPIFVAQDSADVWAARHWFKLSEEGQPYVVAGVPPDYFSATGQRWGNPLYDWQAMREDGYGWWLRRLEHELSRVDLLRIDHFRGFESYWEIPAEEETALVGKWCPGPGAQFLEAVRKRFGVVPVVAEDLGIITDAVIALRDEFSLPGMKVLQFAFGGDASNPYLPHNHSPNAVSYSGTHDNDTTSGWASDADAQVLKHACQYLNCEPDGLPAAILRANFASVASLAIAPMQDFLGLGSEHRMNTPGVAEGNWRWRFQWEDVPPELATNIASMMDTYGRC